MFRNVLHRFILVWLLFSTPYIYKKYLTQQNQFLHIKEIRPIWVEIHEIKKTVLSLSLSLVCAHHGIRIMWRANHLRARKLNWLYKPQQLEMDHSVWYYFILSNSFNGAYCQLTLRIAVYRNDNNAHKIKYI